MNHISSTALRGKLADVMDEVCESRAPLLVTRHGARGVVMLAADEYEGLMETLHLMRSPANAARLLASIAEVKAGKKLREFDPT
jgi:antitoxin YefM